MTMHTPPAPRQRALSLFLFASFLIALLSIETPAIAQNDSKNSPQTAAVWPTRPVRIVVGFPGGSSPDLTARTLAEPLSRALGQPVVVDNKPGASGNIAAGLVAKSTDDHTLGIVINGNLTSAKQLFPKLPYDPATDFAPISLLTTAPLLLVAPASLPGGAEFFAAARAAGDRWNYGSVGNGSVAHLGMELLKLRAPGSPALDAVHVPFAGNPQVITAMLGGDIQMALMAPAVALPHIRAGKLRAVGITSGRSALVPDIAPLADLGVQNLNLEVWNALVGPARLSKVAQARLALEVPAILRTAETREKLFNQGWKAVGSSPEGLTSRLKDESTVLGNIITLRHIKIE